MSKYSSVRGVYDILPEETERWQVIELKARKTFGNYGFSEIRVPVIEKSELFSRSIGEDTDIVEKEMYTFPDRKGELISLRPEGTASVVRAYVEHKMYASQSLTKLYYIGPMFRYERPQKGRRRQFFQIGVEVFGLSNPSIDAEVISMLFTYFESLGLDGLKLNLNSIGCRECRPNYQDKLLEYLSEKTEAFCDNCQGRYRKNPLRVLDCKSTNCREATNDAPSILDHLCDSCGGDFSELKGYLDQLGLVYNVNPRMVRGLDYYTKTAFEITSDRLGSQDAVAAGGRYDLLVEEVGGPPTPAIGFAIGLERLSMILEGIDLSLPGHRDLYIAALGEAAFKKTFSLAHELRTAGFQVDYDHEGRSLKAQMRKANAMGAAYVLILGDDELASGKGLLKDMKEQGQEEIQLEEIVTEMKQRRPR